MKKLTLTALAPLLLFSLYLALPCTLAQTKTVPSKDDPTKQLFEAKCKLCHSLDKVKEAHLNKDKAKDIVEKMRQKPGANISQDEASKIYNYLEGYFAVRPEAPVAPAPGL